MLVKDKYYVPDISEFFVGFEFEECVDGKTWDTCRTYIPNEFIKNNLFNLEEWLIEERIRVKYLDSEDIESLGFGESYDDTEGNIIYTLGDIHLCKSEYTKHDIEIWNDIPGIREDVLFKGIVKNKSELKKLLSWIGV